MKDEICQRTFALFRPGIPIEGVTCSYRYTGSIPCTGLRVCRMCGKEKPKLPPISSSLMDKFLSDSLNRINNKP